MTIPVLITKYQKNQTVTRLKKVYTTITQAVKLSEAQNGALGEWDYALDTDAFVKLYLKPYLSIAKDCGLATEGCFPPEYWTLGGVRLTSITNTDFYKFVLSDGTSVSVRVEKPLVYSGVESRDAQVMVDINGLKKPNIQGRDIFVFWIFGNTNGASFGKNRSSYNMTTTLKTTGVYPDGYGFIRNILLSNGENLRVCSKDIKTEVFAGYYCTALIMFDSWQIADDYPW